jgi:hypothetical protein
MAYPIPKAALDDRLGWLGTTGSGKTYNASAAVEILLGDGARCIIVDPLDVWWGLRLSSAGKLKWFDVVIFGGANGDLPLNEHAGSLVGEAVATATQSCIISLGDFATKAAERRFMLAFLEALYRKANGEPVHLIFDEADLWAPQKALEPQLQSKMEQLVRRGRVKGFIPWLISQRPATISKDVLSQMDGLVMFKMTSPQDRDAIGDWVAGQANKEEWKDIWSNMPTLQKGQGTIWIPARGILRTNQQFPEKLTYDSSRTPKRGERKKMAKPQPIDLGELKTQMASVEKEVKASDPKMLRTEILALKAQLANKREPGMEAVKEAFDNGFSEGRRSVIEGLRDWFMLLQKNQETVEDVAKILNRRLQEYAAITGKLPNRPKAQAAERPRVDTMSIQKPHKVERQASVDDGDLSPAQRRVIESLEFWRSIGHHTPSREQVAAVAGYSPNSSSFTNMLGALRTAGHIDYPMGGTVRLNSSVGRAGMDFGQARDKMLSVLSPAQKRLVDAAKTKGQLTNEELAERSGYSSSSSSFTNMRGALRTLGILEYPQSGSVALSEWAWELLK